MGKLRRLAVLPVVEAAPSVCGSSSNPGIAISSPSVVQESIDFVTGQGGHDLFSLDPECYRQWLDTLLNETFLEEITHWSADADMDSPPGPLTESLLEAVRAGDKADGLLVFHYHDSCDRPKPAMRASWAITSVGVSELLPMVNAHAYPTCRVAILESASGRPVWRVALPRPWPDFRIHNGWLDSRRMSYPEVLFEDLEPAVPQILTR